jgi:hypothetical protein
MTYRGEVRGGVVVFEPGCEPPEGAEVRVEAIGASNGAEHPAEAGDRIVAEEDSGEDDPMAATRAWMLAIAEEAWADAPDLPSDMAENHDHYAHGKPKP